MKIIVQFSGGKDSQACLIWAVKNTVKIKLQRCFATQVGSTKTLIRIFTTSATN